MSHLVLAVPSKGRLQDNAMAFFARAGLPIVQARGGRGYVGHIKGLEGVEVLFLSASEIARELAGGGAHVGVTGEDLVRESIPDAEKRIVMVEKLGFGYADVVVAVPEAWIDVSGMADLDDVAAGFRARHGRQLRIATKYINLTRRFFADHGVVDYRIVESLGATEGAPANGTADAIVDITTTGSTLAANALKVLADGVILKSQANLVASRQAKWTDAARRSLRTVLDRIAAEARAERVREIRFVVADLERVSTGAVAQFGARAPFGSLGEKGVLHVDANDVFAVVDWLKREGASTITVQRLDYIFEPETTSWTTVEAALR